MMNTVPLSPPVTPKGFCCLNDKKLMILFNDQLELPPPRIHSDDTNRKKINVKKFCRSMVESNNRKPSAMKAKPKPRKSLSPSTEGAFTMDLFLLLTNKKRKWSRDETYLDMKPVPSFSTVSILNTERHVKKSKTDAAAAYDRVDITIPDQTVFQDDPKWIPNMKVFENNCKIKVNWKGTPLSIEHLPFFQYLHPGEVHIASTLRLTPEQYLKCRRSLLLAAQDFDKMNLTFRKSDAQKCVRIDVNKTSALWNVFNQLGWFHPSSP